VDEIAQGGTGARRRFTGQAARVSAGCPPAMLTLTRYGGASRSARAAPAGHCPGCVYRSHDLERGGPRRTRGSAARQGTAPVPVVAADHGGGAFPAVAGVPWRCQPGHSGRAETGKAPACMRCRGLARPRRTGWPVARPCWHSAPPAGTRHPYEDQSPGVSHVPGVAPRWCPFPAVEYFYSIRGRHARACGQLFRVLPSSAKESAESGQISAFTAVIHGFIHSYPRPRDGSRVWGGLPVRR